MVHPAANIGAVMAAYAVGCFNAGYYLVRRTTGEDIRSTGSRATGATNVHRRLGIKAAATVFAVDFAKGAAVLGVAKALHTDGFTTQCLLLAVVCGHIWPVQLGGRGRKGAATAFGASLVMDPAAVGICVLVFAALAGSTRRITASGLAAFAAYPVLLFAMHRAPATVWGALALAAVVFWAHRDNLRALTGR